MPYKPNEREYRAMPLLASAAAESYVVEGIATRFNQPYELYRIGDIIYYEEIKAGAFAECDMFEVIMQYDHTGRVLARTSNGTLQVAPTDKELNIWADLSRSSAAKEMHNDIKEGLVTKMSFAFVVDEDNFNKETRTREILKIRKLYDVSAVSSPANNSTEISARSWAEGIHEAQQQEQLKRARQIQRIKIITGVNTK